MTIDHTLTGAVVAFSVLAGIAWFISATAKKRVPLEHGEVVEFRVTVGEMPEDNQTVVKGIDVYRTSAIQSRWNAWAAAAASIAAILQAVQAATHW